MRIHPLIVPVVFITVLLGTVFGTSQAGVWTTSGRTSVNLENLQAVDLKGWMTLQQVMDGFKIPKDELYQMVKIPGDVPETTALKDIEKMVEGFETSSLRDAMATWRPAEGANAKPEPAAVATAVPAAPAVQATAPVTGTHQTADGLRPTPTPMPAGAVLAPDQIKGSMTLRQISDQAKVSLDAMLVELKLTADVGVDTAIKDLVSAGKLAEVTLVRDAVTKLQGK